MCHSGSAFQVDSNPSNWWCDELCRDGIHLKDSGKIKALDMMCEQFAGTLKIRNFLFRDQDFPGLPVKPKIDSFSFSVDTDS